MKRNGSPARRGSRRKLAYCQRKTGKGCVIRNNTENTSLEGTQTGAEGAQTGRTFTQEEVNRIVQDRLAKEKGKGNDELDKRAAELDARERKLNAIDKLRENGLHDYLADALNMNTDEDFQKSMEAIIKMKGETGTDEKYEDLGPGNPIGVVTKGISSSDMKKVFGLD